jgi:hypothetical protein
LTLAPVQHCVEAIGGTASIARLGYVVVKIGERDSASCRMVSSSDALVAPTKPVSVIATGAGLARVEQFELRVS